MFRTQNFLTKTKKNLNFNKVRVCFDVGSFYTRITVNNRLIFNQPTCLLISQDQQAVLSFGDQALAVFGKEPNQTQVIFPIKQGVVYDQEQFDLYLTAVIKQLKKQVDWSWLARTEAIYSVPQSATELDKKIITQSLTNIGFSKITLIPKVEALISGLTQLKTQPLPESQIIALDIGDQTTELVVGVEGFSNYSRTINQGSKKITLAIQSCLKLQHDLLISYQQATKIKHNLQYDFAGGLSAEDDKVYQVAANSRINIRGISTQDNMVSTKTIKSQDLIKSIEKELEKFVHHLKRALSLVKSEQLIAGLNNGMVLTGGGCQLFGLDDYLAQQLQTNVQRSAQPYLDLVTGMGLVNR